MNLNDTELDKFKIFFKTFGVVFDINTNIEEFRFSREPIESIYQLGVSSAIFCFDKDGIYIGTLSDDSGHFEPRLNA